MYKHLFFNLLFALSLIFLTGCATIPKESVELSAAVSRGIQNQQAAYQNLFNSYFNTKKDKIDEWINVKYIPKYMENINAAMAQEGKNEIGTEGMNYIIKEVIAVRDSMQTDLEKARVLLWEKISRDQMLLLNASEQITLLLKSAADIDDARNQLLQNASGLPGLKFNFHDIENIFNEYLLKAGDETKKQSTLIECRGPAYLPGRFKRFDHLKTTYSVCKNSYFF